MAKCAIHKKEKLICSECFKELIEEQKKQFYEDLIEIIEAKKNDIFK